MLKIIPVIKRNVHSIVINIRSPLKRKFLGFSNKAYRKTIKSKSFYNILVDRYR